MPRKKFGEIMLEMGLGSESKIHDAVAQQTSESSSKRIGDILVAKGVISDRQRTEVLGKQFNLPVMYRENYPENFSDIEGLPLKFFREHQVLVYLDTDTEQRIAVIMDPLDFNTREAIEQKYENDFTLYVGSLNDVMAGIEQMEHSSSDAMSNIIDNIDGDILDDAPPDLDSVDALRNAADSAPVVRLVNMLLARAVERGASDIHIELFENRLRVRYRTDGVLHEAESPPIKLQAAIISRIKIMARLDIAERRRPQDGRIKLKIMGKEVDLRVATSPTIYGENLVIRILDKESLVLEFDQLGVDPDDLEKYQKLLKEPHGVILVTGPTGSGKTTTLYCSLNYLNSPEKKIITVEDPVEYRLHGINQMQVNPGAGVTFAAGVRNIVRSDPDIIMIGEIRDRETAENAIQAALTGHLVFSTLHTNDAPGAIARLVDMEVPNYLISSSLIGVLAQRLVRVLCPECKEAYQLKGYEAAEFTTDQDSEYSVFKAVGCNKCHMTGYRGRMAIYEIMPVEDQLGHFISENTDSRAIGKFARELGMKSLKDAGWKKVLQGQTSLAELGRVIQQEG